MFTKRYMIVFSVESKSTHNPGTLWNRLYDELYYTKRGALKALRWCYENKFSEDTAATRRETQFAILDRKNNVVLGV